MSEQENVAAQEEIHEYQAEMNKLLDILIHSLYTEREIFLREVISNASDALSKIQFTTLTNQDVLDQDAALEVKVGFNEEENIVTVEDTGIGMTKEEILNNLGTIASSGTLKFLQNVQQEGKNATDNLIGQFGVGFYSVFMVAKRVLLETRSFAKDSQAWAWDAEGSGQFKLRPSEKQSRGTKITIFLKEDSKEFCSKFRIESIIKKYSNYIPFPIKVEDNTVNQIKAIWSLSKNEVSAEDYKEFYKQLTYDMKESMLHLHHSVDAPIQYHALLFIPQEISNEILYAREGKGVNLYAQRVLIQSDNKNILPPYLRFIRGVVDSEDIPLNVSRESIQNNALIEKIKKSLTSRLLKELKSIAESNAEKYKVFWKQYGALLKEGVSADFSNKEKLLELLRFNSSFAENADDLVSLKEYVSRMRDEQKEIFYAIGPAREAILHNPNYEYFKENKLEVLFLTENIDDFLMTDLREFDGKSFKSISEAELGDIEKNQEDALPQEESDSIIQFFKDHLGEKVKDVISSKRLVGSPCSLSSADGGMSSQMEKMMKMVNKDFTVSKRTLEINMNHPIVKNMSTILKTDQESLFLKDCVDQLFNNAMLIEGLLENPLEVIPKMYRFMEDASTLHVNQLSS